MEAQPRDIRLEFDGALNSKLIFSSDHVSKTFSLSDIEKFNKEHSFYLFANSLTSSVPKLISCKLKKRTLVIERVYGTQPKRVNELFIDDLARCLNELNRKEPDQCLSNATEALLSEKDLAKHLLRRFNGLIEFCDEKFFLENASKIETFISQRTPNINDRSKVVSPSDIGIHNSIRAGKGHYFFDFEYAGHDSFTKIIYDFLIHPANNIQPKDYQELFQILNKKLDDCNIIFKEGILDSFRMWNILRLLGNLTQKQINKRFAAGILMRENIESYKTDRMNKVKTLWEAIWN